MPEADPVHVRLPNWVGDACMCLPALELIRHAGHPLVLHGRPWARELLEGLSPAGFVPLGKAFGPNLAATRHAAGTGGKPRGVVFPNSLSSAALFRLAGIRAAGYRGDGRALFLSWALSKSEGLHEVEVFHRLARETLRRWHPGIDLPATPGPRLELPLTSAHRDMADRVLADARVNRPFVLLAPIATGLHHGQPKAWPLFADLSRALATQGVACVVCPPPQEIDATRRAAPAAAVLPPLGLGAFAALTASAAAVLCNDSGTSHVAAAAGARQITLFGVTRRERTGPWSPDAICLGAEGHWPALPDVLDAVRRLLPSSST